MAAEFWFKFYFKDWADDVKPLSLASRGLLMELIIELRKRGGSMPVDVRLISRLTGGLTEEITHGLEEFRAHGIFDFEKTDKGEILKSRKILKEISKSLTNKENGKKGGNPYLKSDNPSVKRKVNRKTNRTPNSDSISNSDTKIEIVFPFESEKFRAQWDVWKQYKSDQHKFKYKDIAEQAALKELGEMARNEETAIAIIHQSISKGWKGLFELKQDGKQATHSTGTGKFNLDIVAQEAADLLAGDDKRRQSNRGV